MIRSIVALMLVLVVVLESTGYCGADMAPARIQKLEFNEAGNVSLEFVWIGGSGFPSGDQHRRLSFEYQNWPAKSLTWISKVLPWTPKAEAQYPRRSFAACLNYLLSAYRNNEVINLGQMGTVPFAESPSAPGTGIVPFAELIDDRGTKACYVYAAPI